MLHILLRHVCSCVVVSNRTLSCGNLPCRRIPSTYSSSRSSSHGRGPIQCFFRDLMFIQIESTRFRSSQCRQGYSNTAAVQKHPGKNAPTHKTSPSANRGHLHNLHSRRLVRTHARIQTPLTLVLRWSLSLSPSLDPSPIMCCIKLM